MRATANFFRHSRAGGAFNSRRLVIQFLLCSSSSFRRKPESSVLLLARHSSASWNPAFALAFDFALTASLRFSARIRASGSLSLACAREINQREHPPGAALPAAVRKVRPGSLDGHPAHSRTRAHPCARPYGRLRPDLAAADGAQDQEQRQEQKRLCFRLSLFASARRTRALCSSRGPHGLAAAADDKARRVRARDRAHSAVAQDVQSAEPDR